MQRPKSPISAPLRSPDPMPEDGEDRIFGSKELSKTLVLAADLGSDKELQKDAWNNTLDARQIGFCKSLITIQKDRTVQKHPEVVV